jgi:outer membrane lipoprotein
MPQTRRDSLGRFIFEYSGYLEAASYAAYRLISVVGRVQQVQTGRVGETDYLYPVITAQQIYLWPKDSERDRTRFHFGIGIGGGL